MYPADYRRALAESEAMSKAEAGEKQLLDSYAGNGTKPRDAFDELKALAAKATVGAPPRAIAIE